MCLESGRLFVLFQIIVQMKIYMYHLFDGTINRFEIDLSCVLV